MAEMPPACQEDEARWLLIKDDPHETDGCYLAHYLASLRPLQGTDLWHRTFDEAKRAGADYGIDPRAWQPLAV